MKVVNAHKTRELLHTNMNRGLSLYSILPVDDVYHTIIDFLSPKELYNLTLSSGQSCKLKLSLVIRVCLLRGNKNTKVSLERIYSNVLSNSIHVPSAGRLLFLLTSNTCECCNTKQVNLVSCHGLLLCLSCKQRQTAQIEMKSPKLLKSNIQINDIMAHPDVNTMVHHFIREAPYNWEANRLPVYYMLTKPCFDMKQCNIGPIITKQHLDDMLQLTSYTEVESYIESRKPNQADSRLEFISAMTLHREECFDLQQQKGNLRTLSVRKYRVKKFQNVQTAIALIRRYIPDNLKYALNYHICTSFPVSVASGATYICRYIPRSPRVMYPYYAILGSVQVNDVRVMLDEGPSNGKVFIRMRCGQVRRITQPLVNRPTNFNDGTNNKHQHRLLCMAREICMYFGALMDDEYPATWN